MRTVKIGPQDALPDLEPCFDGLFQFHCQNTPGAPPWKFMKAQARQESAFNPLAVSPTGPVGLFQFTKATWAEYSQPGDDRRDVFKETGAAVRYMKALFEWAFKHGVPDEQRPRFALGCFNQGMGNIDKAMRYCTSQGADPLDWGNIPVAFQDVLLAAGKPVGEASARAAEVTNYVSRIMRQWNEYENPTVTV